MDAIPRRRLLTAATATAAGGAMLLSTPSAQAGPQGARPTGGPSPAGPARAGPPHRPPRLPGLPEPDFDEVSVHDPSVLVTGGMTYVFGSHLAAARSADLLVWDQVADLVTPENPLFEDVTTELAEAFEWAQSDTLWAADVSETGDGRFRMYYCACEGSSPLSAMGTAIADHIEGPYRDEGIFLRSGMWDEPSEDGTVYDAQVHPNTIDPHAFVDASGHHRLVYGSYSGGIFLLDLDPDSGRPLPGQGYGVHLCGGNHARIEAPYILHSELTGCYYLLLTFGGLDADGGYNIRVGRSRHVEGPYLDPMGQDLREAKSDPELPLFDDASIEPFGAKLMGNHRFVGPDDADAGGSSPNETGSGQGYVSPGHVSAWADPQSQESYLFFHTRFPDTEELHQVRVHRIHFTPDGWPVLSPHRYAGESAATSPRPGLHRRQLEGRWQLIDHGRAISPEIVTSRDIELHRDGRISGAVTGRWRLEGRYRAVILLDDVRYDGVFTLGRHEELAAWTPAFSVLGPNGHALWGSREV